MSDQKELLKSRIKQLEQEVIDRVRDYLEQHRLGQYSQKRTPRKQKSGISLDRTPRRNSRNKNIFAIYEQKNEDQLSPNQSLNKKMLNPPIAQLNKQNKSIIKALSYNEKSGVNHDQSLQTTIKKQHNLQKQISQLKENKDKIVKELTEQVKRLTSENESNRKEAEEYRELLEQFQQKYGRQSQIERKKQKQSQFLIDKICSMEKNKACIKCGSEDLEKKLAIYITKNQLLLHALNESQEKNYDLRLQIRELQHKNKQQNKYSKILSHEDLSQISQNVFQTICNLPVVEKELKLDQEALFQPRNSEQLKSAVKNLKRISQSYEDFSIQRQGEFRKILDSIFTVIKKITQRYKITREQIIDLFKDADFTSEDKFSVGYRIIALINNSSKSLGSENTFQKNASTSDNNQHPVVCP